MYYLQDHYSIELNFWVSRMVTYPFLKVDRSNKLL